jgi:hypothetical protein
MFDISERSTFSIMYRDGHGYGFGCVTRDYRFEGKVQYTYLETRLPAETPLFGEVLQKAYSEAPRPSQTKVTEFKIRTK